MDTKEDDNIGFQAVEKVLLYYPTIDIPSPSWVRQGLMYWDKIGSIVPDSYDAHLPRHLRYSEQIQPLYDAGLFRPFNPADLLMRGPANMKAFSTELFQILDGDDFRQRLPSKKEYVAEVYVEKVNSEVFDKLLERKLVAPRDYASEFIYFEENASLVYMAVLAKYLADLDNQYTVPSTDLRDYERLNFRATAEDDEKIPCLRVEFRDLLRVPTDDVDIRRVIDFRLKHNEELLHFRHQVLDSFEEEIKNCSDRRQIKAKTVKFRGQVEKGVHDLGLLLNGAKFQTVSGTLKALFKPQHIAPVIGAAAGAGFGVAFGSGTAAAIASMAGLIGGGTVELFDFFVSRKNAKLERLTNNAYSYLYRAEQAFGRTQ